MKNAQSRPVDIMIIVCLAMIWDRIAPTEWVGIWLLITIAALMTIEIAMHWYAERLRRKFIQEFGYDPTPPDGEK